MATATRMCSITSTGVVFLNATALEVSSEITLTVQTRLLGGAEEWTVQGWVVECCPALENDRYYQVTLLFSDLPTALQQILAFAESCQNPNACPRIAGGELFGVN